MKRAIHSGDVNHFQLVHREMKIHVQMIHAEIHAIHAERTVCVKHLARHRHVNVSTDILVHRQIADPNV